MHIHSIYFPDSTYNIDTFWALSSKTVFTIPCFWVAIKLDISVHI